MINRGWTLISPVVLQLRASLREARWTLRLTARLRPLQLRTSLREDSNQPSLGYRLTQADATRSHWASRLTRQPLTAPSIMPLTKKRWKNG